MLNRHSSAQDSPQGARRTPPPGMPDRVPPARPTVPPSAPGETLPKQKSLTDAPAPVAPPRWKSVVRRTLAALGIVLALALAYVFLLMGEPGEDDQLAKQAVSQEETIRVPIAAAQATGDADLTQLAANFGKPVLAMSGEGLTLTKATLFDTAFRGGYARRLTLQYAFADGATHTVESIRPTAAVELLKGSYTLNVDKLYTLAGMDAVRMDSDTEITLVARGTAAVYVVLCPAAHAADLTAVTKLASLQQASAQ